MKTNGKTNYKVICGDCIEHLNKRSIPERIDLTFLDPPFNQDKEYNSWNDNLPEKEYWEMMRNVCTNVYDLTSDGGALYFMQREKNTEAVLRCLRESGWTFQNLIIWKKKTSAVPGLNRYGKHYQIIAYATKGKSPRIFNRLRISPPLPLHYKYERENGIYVTDVWDDIRELTSGYFAGDEAIRNGEGGRFHKQQSPIALLLRIILSSTQIGDVVLDPFAGTGTTLVVAEQLGRKSLGVEIDIDNVKCIKSRLKKINESDDVNKFFKDYIYTENIKSIWNTSLEISIPKKEKSLKLFGE
ncbi:MAG: site-specific DNA-methyltransferase [Bacteroidota bacterium]